VNLLFCTLSYYPGITGGAERQARLQAEELVRRGHRVTVVCARTEDLDSGEINGVRIVRLRRINRRRLFRISYMARLLVWLLRHAYRYDLVHVHLANLQADIAVAVAHRHKRPAYVKIACGGAVGEIQRFRPMAKVTRWYGLRHADRVQVLSDEIGEELLAIGVRAERMIRIPNGIDLHEFRPLSAAARRSLRRQLELPEAAVLVMFVGRVIDYKGIQDLFDAWPRLQHEEARLVIVGATQEQRIDAPERSIVRGWVDDPLRYFQAADIFVHPSHADGMSNSVLEAMACGCALVATEHGATRGFLTADQDALLVPVSDSTALGSALHRVVVDGNLRERLAANARRAVGRYDLRGVVERIEHEYRLLGAPSSPGDDRRADDRAERWPVGQARIPS
jgi:glycosyltransferase involved in cell wall biosynthesis